MDEVVCGPPATLCQPAEATLTALLAGVALRAGMSYMVYRKIIVKKDIKPKVAVAMSGGVDSSVAAALLVKAGYDCFGVFMHFWVDKMAGCANPENKCCSPQSQADAKKVCDRLGIPLKVIDFEQLFKNKIVTDFLAQYQAGRTPNPCVRCNKYIKFGALLKTAKSLGADFLATGHYVKLVHSPQSTVHSKKNKTPDSGLWTSDYHLLAAKDAKKDQSYFLYNLKPTDLPHLFFPVGAYTKPQVRAVAKKFGLVTAQKRESQEICFIPGDDHNQFLRRHLKIKPGKIVDTKGKIIGDHLGLPFYTIGQRRGLGLPGGPYYVVGFVKNKNQLLVTNQENDPRLFKKELMASEVNWISAAPKKPFSCLAKIRYQQPMVPVKVTPHSKKCLVKFVKPQRAVTAGQSVVFYQSGGAGSGSAGKVKAGLELLGGGVIK